MGQDVALRAAPQMNAIAAAMDQDTLIRTLAASLYPGARPESVAMVLSYCNAAGLDPMLKPVHIVPMSVKKPGTNNYEMRDVIMPGITQYRIAASRSGEYVSKSDCTFGEMVKGEFGTNGNVKVSYPDSATITVKRRKAGEDFFREFTATVYWLEEYATAGRDTDVPNAMWKKRPRGQLAKCAEAQALRMAFPELTGGHETADEMAGKTIEHDAPLALTAQAGAAATRTLDGAMGADPKANPKKAVQTDAGEQGEAYDPDADNGDGAGGDALTATAGAMPMPEDALKQWKDGGKWMAGWKWLSMNLPSMPQPQRQPTVNANIELLRTVGKYSDKYRSGIIELAATASVAIDLEGNG